MSAFEPSQAALDFMAEIQKATGNYYKGYWHITSTLKKHGKSWRVLNIPDERNEALSTLSDHARKRRAEKEAA